MRRAAAARRLRPLAALALALALVAARLRRGRRRGSHRRGGLRDRDRHRRPAGRLPQDQVELAIEDDAAFMIGTAVLSPADAGGTQLTVFLDQYPEQGAAVQLREGGCWVEGGEVVQDLGPLEEGQGEFDLDTSPEELLASELALVATGGGEDLGCALVAPYGANLG